MESSKKEKSKRWSSRIKRWLLYASLLYGGLILVLSLNESYLVYPGSKYPRGNWEPDFDFVEVTFESKDGTQLVGWYLPKEGATETVLLCHGNGENVAQSARHTGRPFQAAFNANVFVFDYRSFGKSEGSPDQQGVLDDARAALDWLCDHCDKSPGEIVLVGHSIGGGPAVHLASTVGAKAMFLQRTFASLVEPAKTRFWFVPVNLIMRNRFPSSEWIADCDVPIHQSHGDLDTLVPIESGQKLFNSSPATVKEFWVNEGKGHWHPLPATYWQSAKQFLDRLNQ